MEFQAPEYALPIGFNDYLNVDFIGGVVGYEAAVYVQTMLQDGSIQVHEHRLKTTTAGVPATLNARMDSGWLLQATVNLRTGIADYGEAWANISMRYGSAAAALGMHALTSGYLLQHLPVSWPHIPPREPFGSHNYKIVRSETSPSAGANFTLSSPTGRVLLVDMFSFRLTTDANAANRVVNVIYDDGSVTLAQAISPNNHVASTAIDYLFGPYVFTDSLIGTIDRMHMPAVSVGYTRRLRTSITNIQVGDTITRVRTEGRYMTDVGST